MIEYRLKQGLEEALVELTRIDANRDGLIDAEEKDRYFTARGKELLARLAFREEQTGKPLLAELIDFRLGHSLVQIYRVRVTGAAAGLLLEDRNFPHKPGQISIEVAEGLSAEIPADIDLTHADHVRAYVRRESKPRRNR